MTLPLILIYRKYYGTRFALKVMALMLGTMVLTALVVDLVFSAAGLIPETRPSIESITDRGIHFNYTAVLNILFTVAGGMLLWLTVRRGATDPVCGMRVDRYATPHRADFEGRTYFFCSDGCRAEFESEPEHYAGQTHGTRGGRALGLLRSRA